MVTVQGPGLRQPDGRREDGPDRPGARGLWDSAVTSYYLVLGATLLLVTIGVVMVLSASSVHSLGMTRGASPYTIFLNQAQFAVVGVPLMLLAARVPVRWWKRAAWPGLLAALLLQSLVFTPLGRESGGNRNWVVLAGQSFQPSEFAKVALALWLGVVLARKRHLLGDWRHVLPGALGVVVVLAMVLLGDDLGTAMVVMLLAAGAFFVAGLPMRWFGVAVAAGAAAAAVLAVTSRSRLARITGFFGPECDTQGLCYQTTRGLYGLGSGGLGGVGLGKSSEKWSYLPEAHNDFIFAILGEELGLAGTVLVVALLGVLAVAATRVVRRHDDVFVQITAAGIAAWILGQAIINIAVVLGLLPVIGVPLPLVSAGGSALIATLGALGILLSFARTEPGAREALAARPGVVRRSLAVLGRGRPGRA